MPFESEIYFSSFLQDDLNRYSNQIVLNMT